MGQYRVLVQDIAGLLPAKAFAGLCELGRAIPSPHTAQTVPRAFAQLGSVLATGPAWSEEPASVHPAIPLPVSA